MGEVSWRAAPGDGPQPSSAGTSCKSPDPERLHLPSLPCSYSRSSRSSRACSSERKHALRARQQHLCAQCQLIYPIDDVGAVLLKFSSYHFLPCTRIEVCFLAECSWVTGLCRYPAARAMHALRSAPRLPCTSAPVQFIVLLLGLANATCETAREDGFPFLLHYRRSVC